jgi:hypothetical protein
MSSIVLFISDQNYLTSDIQGGVQLCTSEYLNYIAQCGYTIKEFGVQPVTNLLTRFKVKAGIDVYERYDVSRYLLELVQTINLHDIKLVFFNQLSLAFWITELKKHVPEDVRFVALSHGNESADYLHDISRENVPGPVQAWRLGKQLLEEARLFKSGLHGVVVLNENEIGINRWLGGMKLLYLPRILSPNFLTWIPKDLIAGFVGTLDHLPNKIGIQQLAQELRSRQFRFKLRLVGGPAKTGYELAARYEFIEYAGPLSDRMLADEIKTWSVFLNPVFWYARGASTKLAMAINLGLPCLTTPAGRRGYVLTDETIVTTDDTPAKLAEALIKALEGPAYLQCLKVATERNASEFDKSFWVKEFKNFLD